MGKQSKKVNRNKEYTIENLGDKAMKLRPKVGGNAIDINSLFVEGRPFIKMSDVMKALGPEATSKGACTVLESAGLVRGVDFFVTPLVGLSGTHAICSYDNCMLTLERIGVPLLRPDFYNFMKTEILSDIENLTKTLDKETLYGYTLKDGVIIPTEATQKTEKPKPVAEPKENEPASWLKEQIVTQTKALQTLADSYISIGKTVDELMRKVEALENQWK